MNTNKYISVILLVVFVLFINIISSFINWNVDLTSDKKYSFSNESTSIITSLDDKLFIKVFLDGDFPSEFKRLQKSTEDLIKRFKVIGNNNVDFEFINPNNQRERLIKAGMIPSQLTVKEDGKLSNAIIFPWAEIMYKKKSVEWFLCFRYRRYSTAL